MQSKDAAESLAIIADFVIIQPALAVEKDGAAEGEGQGARSVRGRQVSTLLGVGSPYRRDRG
jgi:hypothetical protein